MAVINTIKLLIEIIIAFILGNIAGYHYIVSEIYTYHAPSSKSVKKLLFRNITNKCYKLIPKVHICPIKYSMEI